MKEGRGKEVEKGEREREGREEGEREGEDY